MQDDTVAQETEDARLHVLDSITASDQETLRLQNKRFLCGQVVKFDETKTYDSNLFNHLDPDSFDAESNGDVDWDEDNPPIAYRPMSERQYYNLKNVRGFLEYNGGNYAGYVQDWYKRRGDEIRPKSAVAEAWRQLEVRKRELHDLEEQAHANALNDDDDVELARRNVLIAQELYGWVCGSKFAASDARKTKVELQSLEEVIGTNLDFFAEYKVGDLQYWILPKNLEPNLMRVLHHHYPETYFFTLPTRNDYMTEILLDENDDDPNNVVPAQVLFLNYIRKNHVIVCSREAALLTTETVLDDETMLNRKRVQNQLDRDARKKRRDSGYEY